MNLYIQEMGDFSLEQSGLFIETLYRGLPRIPGEVIHLTDLNIVLMALYPRENYRYRFIFFNARTARVHRMILHPKDHPGDPTEISKEEIDDFIKMLFSGQITRLIEAYNEMRAAWMRVYKIWREE